MHPNWDFWNENIPSGNPATFVHIHMYVNHANFDMKKNVVIVFTDIFTRMYEGHL
jgi:hypothetical protein